MEYIRDFRWKEGITGKEIMEQYESLGLQATELHKAAKIILKMIRDNSQIFFTFTSNMVTSGLRGFFAQLIGLGLFDAVITTTGAIEEDVMRALGEKFLIERFNSDDIELHEKGVNRVGNMGILNTSYERFEAFMKVFLDRIHEEKPVWSVTGFLDRLGREINDRDSFLHQAHRKGVRVYCPSIIDGSLGFHLYLARQRHPDFQIDIIHDFSSIVSFPAFDRKKGIIALGGGISKHHALLATLLAGGADYAVYLTTASQHSGSMSGATTSEAKSWGKIKDDSDSVTVKTDVSISFPLLMSYVLDELRKEGRI